MTHTPARRSFTLLSPRRWLGLARWSGLVMILLMSVLAGQRVLAQGTGATGAPQAATTQPATTPATTGAAAPASSPKAESKVTLMSLFRDSFDLFTVLLVIGSLAGWTIIVVCAIEIRQANIAPDEPVQIISGLVKSNRIGELKAFVDEDRAFVSRVVRAALLTPGDDKNALREAGELAASEETARWFRKIEPLNVIGNLGPLLGLAGTVWGMIIAFAALGEAGGQANPATLSVGISKALFHTLLGLMLAVPCLTVFGFYRSLVDRLCTKAMVQSADLVELLPEDPRVRAGSKPTPGAGQPGAAAAPRPVSPGVSGAGPR